MYSIEDITIWSHGKWDEPIIQFVKDNKHRGVRLPTSYSNPHTCVFIEDTGDGWLTENGYILSPSDLYEIDALWLVRRLSDLKKLHAYGVNNIICLEAEFPFLVEVEHPIDVLKNKLNWDSSKHKSAFSAWRHSDLKHIRKSWPHGRVDTEQFCRAVDDRPWAETRIAYNLKPVDGVVLDIQSAYACALSNMEFPKLYTEWSITECGERHPYALHLIVFRPTSFLARFYLPFVYTSQHRSSLVAYGSNDIVLVWVPDSMLGTLSRCGEINRYLQTIIPDVGPHPLAQRAQRWMTQRTQNPVYSEYFKRRANAAHTWTWQPKLDTCTPEKWVTDAAYWYGLSPKTRPPQRSIMSTTWERDLDEIVWRMANPLRSGCYLPVFWIRMQLRAAITAVVHDLIYRYNAQVAMVHTDGLHVWADGVLPQELCNSANQSLAKNWPYWKMRQHQWFEQGIWLKPGAYALKRDGTWQRHGIMPSQSMQTIGSWCETLGVLDVRRNQGFWRRPHKISRFANAPNTQLNASRKLRRVLLDEHVVIY